MAEMSNLNYFNILLLIASAIFSLTARASYERSACDVQLLPDSRFISEFTRMPDDNNLGFVTDRVNMTPTSLKAAYLRGIFPWATTEEGTSSWYNPTERGVLFFDRLHISSKDRKFLRQAMQSGEYRVTFNAAFTEVMQECANMVRWREHPETGERIPDGHWITSQFLRNWPQLFAEGMAHSVEVWHNDILVGGLYGTFIGGVFAGESMFHKEDDVTKLALYALIERLKASGHTWIDTQQARGLLKKWGAQTIPRADFMTMLNEGQNKNLAF